MKDSTKHHLALIINGYLVASVAYAIAVKFMQAGFATFVYYTQDSNVLAALVSVVFLASAAKPGLLAPRTVHTLRYIVTCCLTITFLVSLLVLSPYPQSGGIVGMFFSPIRFTMHLTSPVLSFISFAFLESEADCPKITRRDALITLTPSLVYAAFLYPLNIMGLVRGPYPFFLVHEMPLYASVLWFIALLVAFYAIATLIRALSNRRA